VERLLVGEARICFEVLQLSCHCAATLVEDAVAPARRAPARPAPASARRSGPFSRLRICPSQFWEWALASGGREPLEAQQMQEVPSSLFDVFGGMYIALL